MHRACTAPLLAHRFASIANQGGPGADLPRKAAAARLTSSCSSADRHVKAQRCSSWRLLPHSRGVMSGIPVPALQATSGQQQQQRTAVSVAAASAAPDRAAPQQDGGGASAEPDVILQYVVLRRDLWTELSWPLGSIVAQAGPHLAAHWMCVMRIRPVAQLLSTRSPGGHRDIVKNIHESIKNSDSSCSMLTAAL